MTDSNSNTNAKTPPHRVYLVIEAKGDQKNQWTELGAIWPHKDGDGGAIGLKLTPLEMLKPGARLVYRKVKSKQAAA